MRKRRVLFVCTHNSARSHMAEAMLRTWGGERFEAFSAGTEATGIKPETIQVMQEIGISLDGHRSKTIAEFRGQTFEWFITVCDEAQKNCPILAGVDRVGHWSIEDPSLADGSAEERLAVFRRVRDQIRDRLRLCLDSQTHGGFVMRLRWRDGRGRCACRAGPGDVRDVDDGDGSAHGTRPVAGADAASIAQGVHPNPSPTGFHTALTCR